MQQDVVGLILTEDIQEDISENVAIDITDVTLDGHGILRRKVDDCQVGFPNYKLVFIGNI